MKVLALLAVAMLAGEARAAEQFDLVCKGEIRESPSQKRGEPREVRYRVDLAKGEWCREACTVVQHLTDVTTSRITFYREETPLPRRVRYEWIDRATGSWLELVDDRFWYRIEGTCEAAPFSGFGSPTKF
jgi:hypothetical protein